MVQRVWAQLEDSGLSNRSVICASTGQVEIIQLLPSPPVSLYDKVAGGQFILSMRRRLRKLNAIIYNFPNE